MPNISRRFVLWVLFSVVALFRPALANPVTLRFASWDGNEALLVLRKSITGFEQHYPNIKVKLENIDNGSYMQKMLAMYAANVSPDVAMMGFENFQQLAKRGALLPLDPFFALTPDFDLRAYYQPIVKAHTWKGQLYILPRDIAPIGILYYNKKLFDEARVPYPDGSWTWDFQVRPALREKDFLWCVERLTKKDKNGRTVQWGYSPGWSALFGQTLALSTGARFVDNYEAPTKILMDSPEWIRAYDLAADLMFNKKWVPSTAEYQNALQTNATLLFVQGKLAMYQTGIWEVPNLRKTLKPGAKDWFDYDIALFPAYKDGRRAAPTGGSGYSIFSSTKHPREAWLLTQWMAGPEGMKDLAESGLAQPAIRSIALSEPWIPGPHTPEAMQYPKSRIVTDQAVPFVHFNPTADYWPDANSFIGPKTDLIWIGAETPAKALRQATHDAQRRLDQMLAERKLPAFNWSYAILLGACVAVGVLAWTFAPERRIRYTYREKRESQAAYRFIAPWVIGTAVLILGPMILSLVMSFADWDIIQPAKWHGIGNYSEAFGQDPRFWAALKVTLVYSAFAVPLGLLVAMALALLLNQKIRGIPLFRACFYVPSLASLVAASLIWRRIFQQDGGLLNTLIYGADGTGNFLGLASALGPFTNPGEHLNWLGNEHTALASLVIMSLWGVGGAMVILLAGLQGIPHEYQEAAFVDGASAWHRFRHVTLPLLTPTIFFSLVTGIIGSFQVFTQAFVITQGGPNDSTLFYMLHLYNQAFANLRMGYASALAWVLFVLILAFTLLQFRASKWVYYEASPR